MLETDYQVTYSRLVGRLLICLLTIMSIDCGDDHGEEDEWPTVEYADSSNSSGCKIHVLSPPYGLGAPRPDVVSVAWDGKEVFSGQLPAQTFYDGMPVDLLIIRTSPGDHVLEVTHADGRHQSMPVRIEAWGELYFYLFGHVDGKEVLIEPLGSSPRFE